MQRHLRRRRLNQRRATHMAGSFAPANQRAATSTDAGTAGIIWWSVRQRKWKIYPQITQITQIKELLPEPDALFDLICEICVICGWLNLLSGLFQQTHAIVSMLFFDHQDLPHQSP